MTHSAIKKKNRLHVLTKFVALISFRFPLKEEEKIPRGGRGGRGGMCLLTA